MTPVPVLPQSTEPSLKLPILTELQWTDSNLLTLLSYGKPLTLLNCCHIACHLPILQRVPVLVTGLLAALLRVSTFGPGLLPDFQRVSTLAAGLLHVLQRGLAFAAGLQRGFGVIFIGLQRFFTLATGQQRGFAFAIDLQVILRTFSALLSRLQAVQLKCPASHNPQARSIGGPLLSLFSSADPCSQAVCLRC